MKSKYLLLFSVALILMISTFVLAQDKRNNKVKPDKARVEKEKEIPGKGQLNKKKEGHIKKGNDKAVVDEDNNFKYYRDYAKGKKVEICHTEGDENVTISIN